MQVRGGKASCQDGYFVPDTCVVSEARVAELSRTGMNYSFRGATEAGWSVKSVHLIKKIGGKAYVCVHIVSSNIIALCQWFCGVI